MGVAARSPRVVVVVTGDELLRGFVQDANTGFLAAGVRRAGLDLAGIRFCADDLGSITGTLRAAMEELQPRIIVVTGGLGPTHDDRTAEAVAAVSGRPLELDDAALAMVEQRVTELGRMRTDHDAALFAPGNRKQATLPHGALPLQPKGTAPGFVVACDDSTVFVVLPGPPGELRHAWLQALATTVVQSVLHEAVPIDERIVRAYGIPEAYAAAALERIGHSDSDACRVTLCARDGELEISVRGTDAERVAHVVRGLRDSLGDRVFAIDDERSIAEITGALLQQRGQTLAVAESCTGGMLGSMLTGTAGASAWFVGGVISYANEVKLDLLAVSPADLGEHGAVSEPVVRQMAAGVRSATGASVGVSITGIAGPGGGSAEKPVGTVHIAVATGAGTQARLLHLHGDRDTVRRRSCVAVLHLLRSLLTVPAE